MKIFYAGTNFNTTNEIMLYQRTAFANTQPRDCNALKEDTSSAWLDGLMRIIYFSGHWNPIL